MTMILGYPSEADIDSYLSDLGLELLTENNPNFIKEFKQFVYNIAEANRWAMTLRVYMASTTTFNVVGGHYQYDGTAKEYVPGEAIDPTDNDVTYVWLNPDGTIGSGVDASGWPATDHVPLAEVTVDSDGIITGIEDLRGQSFMNYSST